MTMQPNDYSPRISGGIQARDITEEFTKAASALNTGQLVKYEYFTLFEAVGALEIMDAKMDSGYLAAGESLDDDYDIWRELLPEEVVGIMDQLLCHEVAWHMGHPLSQTLFTSIYLNRLLWPVPATLEEAQFHRGKERGAQEPNFPGDRIGAGRGDQKLVSLVLRAYCLALVKACDWIHGVVTFEYYYEEEDFVSQLYNRKLLSDIDSEQIRAVVNEAIIWLERDGSGIEKEVKSALLDRLIFRREFLSALELATDSSDRKCIQHIRKSSRQLELIANSSTLGKSVEDSFSLKIQRRLASTVPPRPMVKVKFEDAIQFMTRLCQDFIDAQTILDYSGPHNLRTSLWALQSRNPQPAVYIRSLCQSLILQDMRVLGSLSIKQFMFDELADLVLPSSQILDGANDEVENPSDFRFQLAKQMESFIKRMAQPFIDTYRTACLNRCRVRRTLTHSVLDWDALQAEAEDFDVQIRNLTLEPPIKLHGDEPTYSYPLSSWAYHHKLRQLRLIIQLGFELSIYSPEELPGMYWYLSHICSTHLGHLERIRACVSAAFQRIGQSSRSQAGRKQDANPVQRIQAFRRTFAHLDRLTTELIWIDAFAIALNSLYTLLQRHNILPSYSLPSQQRYSSEKLRYQLRMKPFLPISLPECIPFEVFKQESTIEGEPDAAVLDRAQRAIAEARKNIEKYLADGPYLHFNETKEDKKKNDTNSGLYSDWVKDVKDSLRACIGTSIAIGTVRKALASQPVSVNDPSNAEGPKLNLSVVIPEVGSKARWHDWWAVPQISETLPLRGSAHNAGFCLDRCL
ncbi:hypothetical protein VTO42DRAFT_526 [Malbranchea cinnamomea]